MFELKEFLAGAVAFYFFVLFAGFGKEARWIAGICVCLFAFGIVVDALLRSATDEPKVERVEERPAQE